MMVLRKLAQMTLGRYDGKDVRKVEKGFTALK